MWNKYKKTILFCLGTITPIVPILSLFSCNYTDDPEPKIEPKNIDGSDWVGAVETKTFLPEDYEIDVENNTVTYKSSSNYGSYEHLIIPDYVSVDSQNMKVLLGPNCFYQNNGIEGIVELNQFIDFIPDQCFYESNNITKIIFHQYPKSIGYRAFYNCIVLNDIVVLPPSSNVEDENWLQQIATIDNEAFWNCSLKGSTELGTKLFFGRPLVSIGTRAFFGCALNTVSFQLVESEDFTFINEEAFAQCVFLEKVVFNNKIKEIKRNAFAGCENLEEIVLQNDNTTFTLGDGSFSGCKKFVGFSRSCKFATIPTMCFMSCESLNFYPWAPEYGCPNIGEQAFEQCSFTTIKIWQGNKNVATKSFASCPNLAIIDFTDWPIDAEPEWTSEEIFYDHPREGVIKVPGKYTEQNWIEFILKIGFTRDEIDRNLWIIEHVPK